MISLMSQQFGFSAFEGHSVFGFLARHTNHVAWKGCVYWDLIQPAFMFIVGVAMPFAYARRRSLGQAPGRIFAHVIKRSIYLVHIAALFTSIHSGQPRLTFVNVLPQIALGYFLAFFVLRSYETQGLAAAFILILYALAWFSIPVMAREGRGPWGTQTWVPTATDGSWATIAGGTTLP